MDAGESDKKRRFLATKESVAKLSIFSISVLILMKLAASVFTGSIGIRADAIHSIIDLTGAIIGFIGIRVSSKPPDKQHAFGHGKTEDIAGFVIAGLIFVAAGTITYEAIKRLMTGGSVELVTVGIYVTAAAIAINFMVSWYSLRIARANDSIALEATARDMLADVLSSCAVLIGLILVKLTGLTILDSIVALLVAILIARIAFITFRKSLHGLMDTRLSEVEEDAIESCIMEHGGEIVGFHKLRTRKAGSERYIDLHLVLPQSASIADAHRFCDHLEQDIGEKLQGANITIHIEPCDVECDQCYISCNIRSNGINVRR